jgi:hypothetical protein
MSYVKRIVVCVLLFWGLPLMAGSMERAHLIVPALKPVVKPAAHHVIAAPSDVSVTIYPGSLKANVERLATYFKWKNFVWQPSEDFNWVGKTKMHAHSFMGIMQTLLANYPLQATFYEGNRVLVVGVRTLK